MLAQIAVSLQPLLKRLPKQVAEIFSFLIIENRQGSLMFYSTELTNEEQIYFYVNTLSRKTIVAKKTVIIGQICGVSVLFSEVLESHFHELYFIPEIPELQDVNKVIRSKTMRRY